jgi:hypothetical protein
MRPGGPQLFFLPPDDLTMPTGKAGFRERFDIAIATTKGHSTKASRELVDALSAIGVTTLVLHDFDKDGLKIMHTLKNDTRRYMFKNKPLVKEIGLRLEQAKKMGLVGERVTYKRIKNPAAYLRQVGATEEEVEFLAKTSREGLRVELNQMTNPQFLAFVEEQLLLAGVKKAVPDEGTLKAEYEAAYRRARIEARLAEAKEERYRKEAAISAEVAKMEVPMPDGLGKLVTDTVDGKRTPWNAALEGIVRKSLPKA